MRGSMWCLLQSHESRRYPDLPLIAWSVHFEDGKTITDSLMTATAQDPSPYAAYVSADEVETLPAIVGSGPLIVFESLREPNKVALLRLSGDGAVRIASARGTGS